MTKDQKIIRAKAGLLELAKQLGNVSQACKIMGYSRDSFYRFKDLYDKGGRTGAEGVVASQANLAKSGRPGDRGGSGGDGDRPAGLGPDAGVQRTG